jgi:hypothetical protein
VRALSSANVDGPAHAAAGVQVTEGLLPGMDGESLAPATLPAAGGVSIITLSLPADGGAIELLPSKLTTCIFGGGALFATLIPRLHSVEICLDSSGDFSFDFRYECSFELRYQLRYQTSLDLG